jgi:zinc-ribbon domain
VAQRYCTNCGEEYREGQRFCGNCGRAVGEDAPPIPPEPGRIETPSQPVPPPPQTGGTGAPSPPQQGGAQPQEQRRPFGRVLLGCLGVFVVVVLIGSCLAALGGSGGQDAANAPVEERERGAGQEEAGEGSQGQQEPEPAPVPEPEPPPEPQPITLSGQGSQATDFFELEEGLSIFEMSYQGRSNFVVTLLNEQGREVGYALGNEIGSGKVSNPLRIARAGRHVLDVDSDGPWQITVRQPRPADAPEITSFSGENNTATKLFSLSSGLKRVNATYDGGGNFVVTMLDSEGHETAYALVNEIGRGTYSTTVTVPRDGFYLFAVEADGPWSLQIE